MVTPGCWSGLELRASRLACSSACCTRFRQAAGLIEDEEEEWLWVADVGCSELFGARVFIASGAGGGCPGEI